MANIPGITHQSIIPEIFAAEVKLDGNLNDVERYDLDLTYINNDAVYLNRPGVYAVIKFDSDAYGSSAMRRLLQLYPQYKTELLLIALRQSMKDIWREQNASTMPQIMAKVLGAK